MWAIRFGVLCRDRREGTCYEVPLMMVVSGLGSVWTACSRSR